MGWFRDWLTDYADTEITTERPTQNLRWNNGVLEQMWNIDVHSLSGAFDGRPIDGRIEWRPVPGGPPHA